MSVGGRIEALWPSIGTGRSSDYPSIEARFGESAAPGLFAQPHLNRYQTFVDVEVPAAVTEQAFHQGGKYRVTYSIVHDRELARFTFRRIDVEGQHRVVGLAPLHRLTVSAWLSASQAATVNDVPFFLQPTVGGRGHLWSVHEGRIGIDGTRATLRGFRSFRFRDRNLLLLQAEYRIPVWGPIDTTVFVDAGKVAARPRDLNFADLKRNYGVGVRLLRGRATAARMDVGFGGGEGIRFLVLLGDRIKANRVLFHYQGGWREPQLHSSITPEDIRWVCGLLNRLSPRQWSDAFRAGGYQDKEADRFIPNQRQDCRGTKHHGVITE